MADNWDDDEWDESAAKKVTVKEEDSSSEEEEEESDNEEAAPDSSKFDPPPRGAANSKATPSASQATGKAETSQKVISKDSMEELELSLQQHVETLVKMVVPKVTNAQAKQAPAKFLNDAVRGLQVKITLQEAEQLQKTLKEINTKRKKQDQEAKKKKLAEEESKKQDDADFFSAFL
eukprot:CAMPEP_0197922752 /NCGR_PEP_ID=MMETSP1439-20131203/92831_1 /TAXON_ID=66791 /ORGANISM="Gonyaulax spinifera, Strain CCMP409" /LENGTH=176 /DNA_ID=CAMNT_0043545071 /DNA_START=78 /DNA_END=608 /DNA_ORIENTATION=+